MEKQKRKQHTAEFKAKVVKEILKEEKTISQLSSEYGVHTSQLYKWRDHALAALPQLFDDQSSKGRCMESGVIYIGLSIRMAIW